jgi:uncharacterized protein
MTSCDANILFSALHKSSPTFAKARQYLQRVSADRDFAVCELALAELYGLLRSSVVWETPITPAQAVAKIQEFRTNPHWRLLDYPGNLMEPVWEAAAQRNFPRMGIYDVRLALTLRHYGVERFATRNVKHFQGYGFDEVFDPTL